MSKHEHTGLYDMENNPVKNGDILKVPVKNGYRWLVNYNKKNKKFCLIISRHDKQEHDEILNDYIPPIERVCDNAIVIDNIHNSPCLRQNYYN